MTRLADAEEREGTPAERPRVDAERERVKILERPVEEAQERASTAGRIDRHLDRLRATVCEMKVPRAPAVRRPIRRAPSSPEGKW
jgi:hypothetical protein